MDVFSVEKEESALIEVLGENNCTYPLFYWQNHPDSWPVELSIGGRLLTKESIWALYADNTGDNPTLLLKQIYTTFLNILHGSEMDVIEEVLTEAVEWLSINPPESELSEFNRQRAVYLAEVLEGYNNGIIGPGKCKNAPGTPTPTLSVTPTWTAAPPSETPLATSRLAAAVTPTSSQAQGRSAPPGAEVTLPPHNQPTNPPGVSPSPTVFSLPQPVQQTPTLALFTAVAPTIATPTPTPTSTSIPTLPMAEPTNTATLIPPTRTPRYTATSTPTRPTSTSPLPTSTNTLPAPTNTLQPTATSTVVPPSPTNTRVPTATATLIPPSPTFTPLPTATATNVPPSPTFTPLPTDTPIPTSTPVPTSTPPPPGFTRRPPTNTPEPTATPSPTSTPTPEPTLPSDVP
jgi:hypothetical protein